MNRKYKIIIHVIIPVLIGGFIYILFRENNLLMFSWFESLGLDSITNYLRNNYLFNNQIPEWIIYSLPDGIWIYSFTSLMLIIWYRDSNKIKYYWLLIGPILGVSAEICQLIEIIPGTYDNLDLAFCICGSFIPFYIFSNQKTRRIK